MHQSVEIAGEELRLLPERAIWWEKQKALLLADVHWGKSGHFRRHGIAMPGATQEKDAQRLAGLITRYQPERLIIAGDLFHSRHNAEVEAFGYWRHHHAALHIDFIPGNHDRYTLAHHQKWDLTIHENSLSLEPFFITHDPQPLDGWYNLYGHIHPGISVPGAGSFPAFCFAADHAILPAFGAFTGLARQDPRDFEQVFVVGEGKVLAVKQK